MCSTYEGIPKIGAGEPLESPEVAVGVLEVDPMVGFSNLALAEKRWKQIKP